LSLITRSKGAAGIRLPPARNLSYRRCVKRLEGRVAIVTGGGRGIGRAIAGKLAAEGARIVLNDLDEEPARVAMEELRGQGAEVATVVGDVTAPDFGERIVAEALTRFRGLDIVVNNAGYIWNTTIQKTTDEQWQAMLDVHATAPFRVLRAAGDFFREAAKRERQEGNLRCRKVVNISSISGIYGAATQIAYSAGKAAVVGITKTLAKEWGRYNVTVNCVAFGDIATRLTEPLGGESKTVNIRGREHKVGLDETTLAMLKQTTPLGRRGTVNEAAGAVYLFCIPESDFVSGQVLVCSGGLAN
jgi:3-oxoacyl-[acyl-carrier protein] reductase